MDSIHLFQYNKNLHTHSLRKSTVVLKQEKKVHQLQNRTMIYLIGNEIERKNKKRNSLLNDTQNIL